MSITLLVAIMKNPLLRKYGFIAALIGLLILYVNQRDGHYYDLGWEAALVQLKESSEKAVKERISSLKQERDEAVAQVRKRDKMALRDLQSLSEVDEERDIDYVVKVVENDGCKSLSSDYIELLNEVYSRDPLTE